LAAVVGKGMKVQAAISKRAGNRPPLHHQTNKIKCHGKTV